MEGDGVDPVGKLLLVVAGVVNLQGHREDDSSHEHLRPLHRVLGVHVEIPGHLASTWLTIRLIQLQVSPYQELVGSTEIWSRHITKLPSVIHCQSWKSNQPNHLKIHNIHFLNVPENFVSSTRWPVWLWVFWKSHLEVLSWTMTMMPGKYGVVIIMDSDLHLASCVPAPKSYKKVWWSMKIVDRLDNVWCWCEMV